VTLKGKRILVLGGTSGIGLAVAEAVVAEDSEVVVISSQQSRVAHALSILGPGAQGFTAQLSDEASVDDLFAKVGKFDHMIYTAGDSVWQRPIGDTMLDDAKRFFEVRFWGAFLAAKHGSKQIRPGGGNRVYLEHGSP
jgi:NAD(P)-dependent dehydrogenase (short-subunit alcohol dehydrogenase family)